MSLIPRMLLDFPGIAHSVPGRGRDEQRGLPPVSGGSVLQGAGRCPPEPAQTWPGHLVTCAGTPPCPPVPSRPPGAASRDRNGRRGLTSSGSVKATHIWALRPRSRSLAPRAGTDAGARLAAEPEAAGALCPRRPVRCGGAPGPGRRDVSPGRADRCRPCVSWSGHVIAACREDKTTLLHGQSASLNFARECAASLGRGKSGLGGREGRARPKDTDYPRHVVYVSLPRSQARKG